MKKTFLTLIPIIVLALILSLSFTSCKKGWWGYEEGKGGGNENKVQGTIYLQDCGIGIYGKGLWIKLNDGTLLQPSAQSFETLVPIVLKEGDKVEINFSGYKGNYLDFEPFCKIIPFKFKRVTIDYINVISNKTVDCNPIPLPTNYEQQEAAIVTILNAAVVDNRLKLQIGYSGCSANIKRFGAIGILNFSNDIPTYNIKLIDSNPEMCLAYFTNDICFDLAAIKKLGISKRIRIILNDYDKIFEF